MLTPTLVSIIIPIYNVSQHIEAAADSILSNDYQNCEFIFVNDATPDDSVEKLTQLIENKYSHIKQKIFILHHKENRGLAQARQTGLEHASGDYIISFDSDDTVNTTIISKLTHQALKTDADVTICGYCTVNQGVITKHIYPDCSLSVSDYLHAMLIGKEHSSTCNKLVRRQVYTKNSIHWHEGINMLEDMSVMHHIFLHAKSVAYVNETLYYYNTYRPASYTSSRNWAKHQQALYKLIQLMDSNISTRSNQLFSESFRLFKTSLLSSILLKGSISFHLHYYKLFSDIKLSDIINHPNLPYQYKLVALLGGSFPYSIPMLLILKFVSMAKFALKNIR